MKLCWINRPWRHPVTFLKIWLGLDAWSFQRFALQDRESPCRVAGVPSKERKLWLFVDTRAHAAVFCDMSTGSFHFEGSVGCDHWKAWEATLKKIITFCDWVLKMDGIGSCSTGNQYSSMHGSSAAGRNACTSFCFCFCQSHRKKWKTLISSTTDFNDPSNLCFFSTIWLPHGLHWIAPWVTPIPNRSVFVVEAPFNRWTRHAHWR